jgi:hypothetical protein
VTREPWELTFDENDQCETECEKCGKLVIVERIIGETRYRTKKVEPVQS